MSTVRKVTGLFVAVSAVFSALRWADSLAKTVGIFNLPRDLKEVSERLTAVPNVLAAAIALLGAACLTYLIVESRRGKAFPTLRSSQVEAGLIILIGLCAVAIGVIRVVWPPGHILLAEPAAAAAQKPKTENVGGIEWNVDFTAGINLREPDEIWVTELMLMGVNISGHDIVMRRARAISSITGEEHEMLIVTPVNNATLAEINPIPPNAMIQLRTELGRAGSLDQRMNSGEFLRKWGVFRFVVEYGDTVYTREVTAAETERYLIVVREGMKKSPTAPVPRPVVTRKAAPG